ncbi:enhanced serine sensitivity protein SseB C-terminal domain-containing protein [Lacticaseibacillus baoqingensis]|uniref:Enhanced serine sensitivity protein SseB C-terminal domain-containing protein n=1 Tax=Lacticaseibacillus baoqingensis TaxID=2486013 RepID=A0ABW4E2E8_9LACO|nr:enhanced serine sensitivity protein SseB C-terminal domain-containing protein [Lacticaseibacillus baoqingensis]
MGIFNFGKNNDDQSEHEAGVDPVHQVTNDDLLALWRTATIEKSDANMSAFLEELIERANLITFALSDDQLAVDDAGHMQLAEGTEVRFPLLTGADEKTFQPFFTDWQAASTLLAQWQESGNQATVDQSRGVVVNFKELVQLVGGNDAVQGLVINPFEDNITLDSDAVVDLAKQAQQRQEQADQPVHVGDGQKAPDGLLEALVDKFVADGHVNRAWMRTLTMGENQSFFLILDLPERDDHDQFFDELTVIANEYLADSELGLTIAPYSDELAGAIDGAVPFYAK